MKILLSRDLSAKNLRREGLQSALAALDAGNADGLLVAKLDRLTRSVRDLADLAATMTARVAALEARVASLEEDSPALDRARERRRYNLTRRMA